jgi:hypothetical protein
MMMAAVVVIQQRLSSTAVFSIFNCTHLSHHQFVYRWHNGMDETTIASLIRSFQYMPIAVNNHKTPAVSLIQNFCCFGVRRSMANTFRIVGMTGYHKIACANSQTTIASWLQTSDENFLLKTLKVLRNRWPNLWAKLGVVRILKWALGEVARSGLHPYQLEVEEAQSEFGTMILRRLVVSLTLILNVPPAQML